MQTYDTTFIVNPQTDDASIDREVRSVADVITGNGGQILRADRLGTRRLAYAVQGLTQGYYACFIYQAPAAVPRLLDRHFRLGEAFLRHLTVVFEGELKPSEEAEAAKQKSPAASQEEPALKKSLPAEEPAPEIDEPDSPQEPAEQELQETESQESETAGADTEPPARRRSEEIDVPHEDEEL